MCWADSPVLGALPFSPRTFCWSSQRRRGRPTCPSPQGHASLDPAGVSCWVGSSVHPGRPRSAESPRRMSELRGLTCPLGCSEPWGAEWCPRARSQSLQLPVGRPRGDVCQRRGSLLEARLCPGPVPTGSGSLGTDGVDPRKGSMASGLCPGPLSPWGFLPSLSGEAQNPVFASRSPVTGPPCHGHCRSVLTVSFPKPTCVCTSTCACVHEQGGVGVPVCTCTCVCTTCCPRWETARTQVCVLVHPDTPVPARRPPFGGCFYRTWCRLQSHPCSRHLRVLVVSVCVSRVTSVCVSVHVCGSVYVSACARVTACACVSDRG